MEIVIGIDAGTSMTKVVAFDLEGNEIAKSSMETPTATPEESWIEEEMYDVWNSVVKCTKDVIAQVQGDIKAIGICSTGDGTWMVDENLEPVRPGIMWCDGRAQEQVTQWHQDGTAKEAFKLCGTSVFTGTQAAQIKWLEKHEPESLARAKYIFHEKDWIFYKLTGQITTDDSDESLTNIDLKTKEYDPALFKVFGIEAYRDKYPPLRTTVNNWAPVTADIGLPKGTIVGSGPMDVQSHAVGVGAIEHGQGSSVLGTAGLHQVIMNDTYIDDSMVGMTLAHSVPERWMRLAAAMIATPNLDWILDTMGERQRPGFDYNELEKEIDKIKPGSNGLIYHPYLFPGGERAPFVRATAKASFFGLSQHHTKYHMIRAVYEGVGLSMLDCYRHMPVEPYEVRLSGGGSTSPLWSQMVCDMVGKPVVIPSGTEYGAKGAAINAAVAAGLFKDYREATASMIRERKRYEPNMERNAYYSEVYELYKAIYESHMELWDKRAALLRR